jgi:CRISPR-associated protein Csx14
MDELRIPLDPVNPGQFFACCGLFDLLAGEGQDVFGRYEASESTPRQATFVIEGSTRPLGSVLSMLRQAESESVKPADREDMKESVFPVALRSGERGWSLDWWLDEFRDKTTQLKCWAGQVKSGNLVSELLTLIEPESGEHSLFTVSAMSKAKFGIDPRSAWNALDFGYSPNAHNKDAATYPAVEVLGCIGLQAFRPVLKNRVVPYCLWTESLPLTVARLAAFRPWPGLPRFEYEFSIGKRGQSYKFFGFAQFRGRQQ